MCQLYYIYKIVNCLVYIHILEKHLAMTVPHTSAGRFPAEICTFLPFIAKEHA